MSGLFAGGAVGYLAEPHTHRLDEDSVPPKQWNRFRDEYFDKKHKIKVNGSDRMLSPYQVQLQLRKAFQVIEVDDLLGMNDVIIGELKTDYKQVSFWLKQYKKVMDHLAKQFKQFKEIYDPLTHITKLFTPDSCSSIISSHIRETEERYGDSTATASIG